MPFRLVCWLPMIAWLIATAVHAQTPGPGVPSLSYPPNQLFQVISRINSTNGAPRGHGFVAMHNGYLMVLFSNDAGGGDGSGGFAFFDLSNPYSPVNVFTTHNNPLYGPGMPDYAGEIREPHAFSFSGEHVCIPTRRGLQFWDFSQIGPPTNRPVKIGEIAQLPGVTGGDYSPTPWWVCWQGGRYIYVAGTSTGLHIVDASNPAQPVLVNRGSGRPNPIPTSQTGGFRLGTIFAIGNLLVITGNDVDGMATLDISDPVNPVLLATHGDGVGYSAMVNGNRILAANDPARIYSIAANGAISLLGVAPNAADKGGYGVFQDGHFILGSSNKALKLNIQTPGAYTAVGAVSPINPGTDLDFATAIGNLMFVGDDHGIAATYISPHQAQPDTAPPSVNMVIPRANSVNQALTSRVGLTFTDQIDIRTVNTSTFIVRRAGFAALPGRYSHQTGIVNFWPDSPLMPDTTYEIVVPAGGIQDYAGNPTTTTFTSLFSTGSQIVLIDAVCEPVQNSPAVIGELVAFDVENCTGNLAGITYSWDFGDGSPSTPFSANSHAIHAFAAAGRYSVTLTISNGSAQRVFGTTQTIVYPPTPVQPQGSSTIAYDAVRQRVWVVNQDNDSVTAIDAMTLTRLFEQPVGQTPRTIAIAPGGRVWATNQEDATISVLDGLNGQPLAAIPLPYASGPFGIVFSPTGDAAYVTLEATGRLIKLDPATGDMVDEADVGSTPRGIDISHDGQRVFVMRFISPADVGRVTEVHGPSMSVVRSFSLAMDPGPDREDSGRGVPNYLLSAAISPDGRRLWVPSKKDNIVRGQLRSGEPLTFESTVRTVVSQIDLVANSEELAARRDLNDRALASAIAFTRMGDYAFVTTLGTNSVDVLDAFSGTTVTAMEEVGLAPTGLVLSTDGMRLFVHNFMSRDVAVYDVSDIGRGNQTPRLAVIPTVTQENLSPPVLRGKQIFYNAADRRMSQDRYISCATCHLDGDSDGRVWDFTDRGEGLRKTIALTGRGGTRHGPVHWSANFDEIQDFEHDIRNSFGGTGLMTDEAFNTGTRNTTLGDPKVGVSADLDALAAYVGSLRRTPRSPYREPHGSMTAEALAGRELFHSPEVGCSACHAGSRFTDSNLFFSPFILHDVGTIRPSSGNRLGQPLTGLDSPTLKGIWQTPPYLHDGSAATLMDVLTIANPNDLHGRTSHLSPAQLEALVAYLRQIDRTAPMDFDVDEDVDQSDYGRVQACISGSTIAQMLPDCVEARLDDDLDVDQNDVSIFTACAAGSAVPVDAVCRE